jgi:menaquinone-dependent protoporphyrinogen oxidase
MKAVILYDTKHGTTAGAAAGIAQGLGGEARLLPLSDAAAAQALALADYDLVVVGGPIYFGQWSKAALSFLSARGAELGGGRLALFALGSLVSEGPEAVRAALPALIAAGRPDIGWFGGRMEGLKLSLGERLIVKMVSKSPQPSRDFDPEAARAFGAELGRRYSKETTCGK